MSTLSAYIVRRTSAYFALGVVVVLSALALERLMRLVEEVTNQGAPVSSALEVLGYLLPHYLELAIPAAFFLAALLTVRRLHTASELLPMMAAGISVRRIARPMLAMALVLTLLALANASHLQPVSRHAYRAQIQEISQTSLALGLAPGVFHRVNDRFVVRADGVTDQGRTLLHFFAEAQPENGPRTLVVAERARLVRQANTGKLVVQLFDGSVVRFDGSATGAARITFTDYTWEPPMDSAGDYGPRGQDSREFTVPELIAGGGTPAGANVEHRLRSTELHTRLVHVASLIPLTFLAVPLALLGRGRTGRAYGLGLGVVLVVLYQKVLSFGENFAEVGVLPPPLALWGPFAVLFIVSGVWLLSVSESGVRGAIAIALHPRRPPGYRRQLAEGR
ncbi:lipopolysaccharide export system permease protein [Limimonas halophila]|uniref:Lipopolysaccharide export system permease protein n=1 Tax=Limimonas halophila TaxID=1082479 RepID=A0A1G7PQN9_9PROT|nr:LptF/LptG family permease [Limimonas halophila]SDF88525.1 lipopolysaccharide export system permease protein [Limimonas halophila]